MTTALEAIAEIVSSTSTRHSIDVSFPVTAGALAGVLVWMAIDPWKLTTRSAVMGVVVALGTTVGFAYPEYREAVAHSEHATARVAEIYTVAMRGISEGEVEALHQADADVLAAECRLAAFLDAADADGSRIRLASNRRNST